MPRRDGWTPRPPTRLERALKAVHLFSAHYLWPNPITNMIVNGVGRSALMPMVGRRWLLRAYGVTVGRRCRITPGVYVGGRNLVIGDHTFINRGALLDASWRLTIGARVAIGPHVMLITSTHGIGRSPQRAAGTVSAPVKIGNGVWIGAGATILPGVTVGDGAVIGAGAVVTKDCLPDVLYAGVPARPVKDLDDEHLFPTSPAWSPPVTG